MLSICNETSLPTPFIQSHKTFCAHFHRDLQDYSKENSLWIVMVAKETSSPQPSVCWNCGGDSPQLSSNYGRKGGSHGSDEQNVVFIFCRDPEKLVLTIIRRIKSAVCIPWVLSLCFGEEGFTFFKLNKSIDLFFRHCYKEDNSSAWKW